MSLSDTACPAAHVEMLSDRLGGSCCSIVLFHTDSYLPMVGACLSVEGLRGGMGLRGAATGPES